MKSLTEHLTEHRIASIAGARAQPIGCLCKWRGTFDEYAAHVAAAWREERTVTVDELAALPDGTWVRDAAGDVGRKQDWPLDLAVIYPGCSPTWKTNANIPDPVCVLWHPDDEAGA